MKINEILTEAPIPDEWDKNVFSQTHRSPEYPRGVSFKARLDYALARAAKLGTGSSRVATVIEYEGRPTVLKIAKNAKGLAQNAEEGQLLSEWYVRNSGIVIPIIDYDEENDQPLWIHTEKAEKATEKQLCKLIGCVTLHELVHNAGKVMNRDNNPWVAPAPGMNWENQRELYAKAGYPTGPKNFDDVINIKRELGVSEQDLETYADYVNTLADLSMNFNLELGDFARAANWGIFEGKPVLIDLGFTTDVMKSHYSR